MTKATLSGISQPPTAGSPGFQPTSRGYVLPEGVLSPAHQDLRRLRYFIDLLITGYRSAVRPDLLPGVLRAERIALGIDLPELDTVPLWASRRDDGTLSIPFIEFALARICDLLESFCREIDAPAPAAVERLLAARQRLDRARRTAGQGAEGGALLPRLNDVYLPEELIHEMCGPGGLLERVAHDCNGLLEPEPALAGVGARGRD